MQRAVIVRLLEWPNVVQDVRWKWKRMEGQRVSAILRQLIWMIESRVLGLGSLKLQLR